MRAHGVQRIDAQPEDLAVLVERQFAGDDLVAAVRVAEQRLRARRHPFHRPAADAARRPHHQRIFRIAAVLHAEAAADVGRDDAQLGLGDFQHLAGDRRAGAVRILRGRIERVAVAVGMIVADRGARLDRVGGDAGVVELQRDDVLGAGEGGVGRVLVAHHQRERDIVRRLVPDRRRAGLHRVLDRDRPPAAARNRSRSARRRCAPAPPSRQPRRRRARRPRAPCRRRGWRAACESPSGRPCPRASAAPGCRACRRRHRRR